MLQRSNQARSQGRTKGTFTCCAQRPLCPTPTSTLCSPAGPSCSLSHCHHAHRARDPLLQPSPAQAPTSEPLSHHLYHPVGRVPGPIGLGHPWLPVPLDLGAFKGGRNVLMVSTTLPANKRSKLGGAEPAGGIWQLTCHFVRHWSKLISLAESP